MKKQIVVFLFVLCLGISGITGCSCNENETIETTEQHGYTVYITDTGTKYHKKDCQYLSHSCNAIGSIDAKEKGYTPCSVCNP